MALAQTTTAGGAVPLAVIQLKRVPKTALARRADGPLVALEHPEFMHGDRDLSAAVGEIEGSRFSRKGKYRRQADGHRVDLELPLIAGDTQGSWLSTVDGGGASAGDDGGEDPRAAAMRALIAQGLGEAFAPPPPPSDNREFRTRTPMPDPAVPKTLMDPDDVKPLPLTAFHGLVYSQVFGPTTIGDIKDILGTFGEDRVLETLDELCVLGVVEVPPN